MHYAGNGLSIIIFNVKIDNRTQLIKFNGCWFSDIIIYTDSELCVCRRSARASISLKLLFNTHLSGRFCSD